MSQHNQVQKKDVVCIKNETKIQLENTRFDLHDLKQFMRNHKDTLQEIIIKGCSSNYKRFQIIHTLFLEADLLLIDFTNLNKLEVKDMQPYEEENNQLYQKDMDSLYDHSIKNLMAEFNIHQMLRQNLNQDKSKIVIKQICFDSKHAFYYSLNALLKYRVQIKCVSFVNILDMKINPMKAFCEKIRDLFTLTEVQFINVLFSDQNILQIRYLLNWKQQSLERLVFKRIQMSEYQLELLFSANNFTLQDLTNLKKFIFKCDEKLQKCQVYKNLIKKYKAFHQKETKQVEDNYKLQKQVEQQSNIKNELVKEKDYIKQKLFEPKHIIIHSQNKSSQFSSFQKEFQQPLKMLLFQLSQSNFCEELDISAFSLIGAPQEIINYLIKAVCDSLSLHTLKIQNCQELIHLLHEGFRQKNNSQDLEVRRLDEIKSKSLLAIKQNSEKQPQSNQGQDSQFNQKLKKQLRTLDNDCNINEHIQSEQLRSNEQLSHRQNQNEHQEQANQPSMNSNSFIKIKKRVKRKALKQFIVEGNDHNIFGQSSLNNIIQMMYYSEALSIDFNDSTLTKDGMKGILDGFEQLKLKNDYLEIKKFTIKNMKESNQIDGQSWMKFGQNLFLAVGEYLESIALDGIKAKESVFLEIMRGIFSYKVKQLKIKLRSFIINQKTDTQMQIYLFLNQALQYWPLQELRISSQVDSTQQKNNIVNTNNYNYFNKIQSNQLYSHNIKSYHMSVSQANLNDMQSQVQIQRQEIILNSCSTLKILQLSHFKQIDWYVLIKNIVNCYPKLEELDISDNNLNLDFISFLTLNSNLSNMQNLKKLNLSKNPLKSMPSNPRQNQLQNSQISLQSGNLENSTIKQINQMKYQQTGNQKHKVNLQQSLDLDQTGLNIIKQHPQNVFKLNKDNEVERNEYQKQESIEFLNNQVENHKQQCSEASLKSDDNIANLLDASKNNMNQLARKRQSSNFEVRNLKAKNTMTEDKPVKKYEKVMSDFFAFIFKIQSLEYLDLSSTQITNTEVEMIENQIKLQKESNLSFENINLNGNNDIIRQELFKKKIQIFQSYFENPTKNQKNQNQEKTDQLKILVQPKINYGSTIKELNFQNCDLGNDFYSKVIEILKLKQCQFRTINLSDNSNITEAKWKDIMKQMLTSQGRFLENLYLTNCKFKDSHIIEICSAIKEVCEIQKEEILKKYEYGALQLNLLDLSSNSQIKEGWSNLIQTLLGSVLISLRSIILRNCSINNIKTQYLLEGLQVANLELRKNSDICLRCLEQIDLKDNPIPLGLQVDLQRSFLLSNILQSQISQVQECNEDLIKNLQNLEKNKEFFIHQIQKCPIKKQIKPSATQLIFGIQSSDQLDTILPEVLKSFSYIDSLVIHINYEFLDNLIEGLQNLEMRIKNQNQEEFAQYEATSIYEIQQAQLRFRSVTLILNIESLKIKEKIPSFQNLQAIQQKKSKFNVDKKKNKSKKIMSFGESKSSDDSHDSQSDDEKYKGHKKKNRQGNIINEEEKIRDDQNLQEEEAQDLIFNYQKHLKNKQKKQKLENDEYDLNKYQTQENQIEPQKWERIIKCLFNISNFEELTMQNCKIDGRVLDQICKITSLVSLNISDNHLLYLVPSQKKNMKHSNQNFQKLTKINPFEGLNILLNFSNLQELNLSNTNINARFVKKFTEILKPIDLESRSKPYCLKKINLSQNKMLQKQEWQTLIKELLNNTCLETLILSDCNIGKHNVQGLINALLYAVNTDYLHNIDLSYNKSIYPEDWGIIIVNLFNRYRIQELNVSYCAIYDQKLKNILKNLFLNKIEYLKTLDFSGNYIENPENLFKFMNLLYQASKIEEIKFENCNLNKKNTEYFNDQVHLLQIRTLKTHSSLQIVNFSNNPQILESYCHSYTYFQTFLENSTQYFQKIQEIYLENCLIDQAKINSFIQCFISINSKGLKINSLLTLNISGNRILGQQFSEMLPLIIQVASSLQNLYIGFNTNKCQQYLEEQYQENIIDQQNLEFPNNDEPQNAPLMNGIQGITAAFKKINQLNLNKIQISDDEEVSESDWTEFLEVLLEKTSKSLQHIMICGQRKMHIKESMFFSSLHKILRQKRHSNQFLKEYSNQKAKGDKIDLQIQSIGYFQGMNQKIYVLTASIWPSFVKNGFQPELESGNILQLDKQEYDKYFWQTPTQFRNVYIKLHNDMSIMKFEGSIQNDSQQNLSLKADLFIALNQLRKYLNCELISQNKVDSRNQTQTEIQAQLFLNINYKYSKLPIFQIQNVLRAPLQFREVDLTPILKGYDNLTFDYPFYLFLIQTCNLYPCDSMTEFFVKFIKSLSTYYFSIDQNIFNMIQASPHFFLTEKDRDNIQRSLNKYKHLDQEEEEQKLKNQESMKNKNVAVRQNNNKSKQNTQIIQQDYLAKKTSNNKQLNNLGNSFQSFKQDYNGIDSFNRNASNILSNNFVSQLNGNINQSKIINAHAIQNLSSNQLQQDALSINNKLNDISQNQLIPNRQLSDKQPTQIIPNLGNNQIQYIGSDLRQSTLKPQQIKKQITKAHIQKLEQQKKFWTVLCPYYFQSESMDGVEEIQIIHRIQKMPPSELELKGMSISAIKTIYAFCFQNPYFTACQMDYNHSVFVNTSLAWSLREKIYRHYCNYKRNPIKNKLQSIFFQILRLMIRENVFYKYDNSAILLDQYYSKKNLTLYLMMFLIIFFHILTILVPFIFSNQEGATWDSHFIYAGFSIITFVFELYLVKDILNKILHLTPGFYVVGKSSTYMQACFQRFKKALVEQSIINYKYLIFLWYLITSQFSRFNTYSDFCFLVLCWRKNSITIFYFSTFILLLNKAICFYRFVNIILKDELKRKLPGNNITKFYETSIQLDFIAFSEVLDIVSPYNVTRIPNNWLTKLIIPKISGQSMNQRIYYQLLRILFEDVPQIIIQIIYLIGQINIYAYISLIMSFISFSLAFYKILSIRPSIISQLDFDELKIQKQTDQEKVLKEFEEKQNQMLIQLFQLAETQKKSIIQQPQYKLKPSYQQNSPSKLQQTYF
ncbi:transmembrane protein, putative (macronuclear) [Tetrahymena thermophila SB210]|uniref:Transmembrane protein, putative n=1 Tax=Tetrahymena thermophila (strain SB210) TaxID=312017 RepID=I7LTN4_TETTS|nr:transmembrane protein, putative [Tetrahymena thermophila SB210]EAR85563.2 transmembrane protein, putative [Tetrahymena thermophila SB210]|eukprot:XP_001033226.2 transmembrane protein, putative [Tetrahymena thermophila SB210]